MMQEHPFFSQLQIFYGKPISEEEEKENALLDFWCKSLGETQTNQNQKIGLFFFWSESSTSPEEIHFS